MTFPSQDPSAHALSPEAAAVQSAPRLLTGRHVFLMFAGFFTLIIIVNIYLLYAAFSTFRGVEVESSYRAGRAYPQEIEAAKAQNERGWQVSLTAEIRADGALDVRFTPKDASGAPQTGLLVAASLQHPVNRKEDRKLTLYEIAPGQYQAISPDVRKGKWMLHLDASLNSVRHYRTIERVILR